MNLLTANKHLFNIKTISTIYCPCALHLAKPNSSEPKTLHFLQCPFLNHCRIGDWCFPDAVLYLLTENLITLRDSLGVFKRLWNSNDHWHPGEKSIAALLSWKTVMHLGNSRILLIGIMWKIPSWPRQNILDKLFPSQKPVQEKGKSREMDI